MLIAKGQKAQLTKVKDIDIVVRFQVFTAACMKLTAFWDSMMT
jgi:hypothetical protein